MHNHDNKENSPMKWAMMVCCVAPFFLILLFGAGAAAPGALVWIVIGVVAIVAVTRLIKRKRSPAHSDAPPATDGDGDTKHGAHSGHGCCH